MSEWTWGRHADVGLHFLKLYSSGLFDPSACPHLKLILGHASELVPSMLARSSRFFRMVCTDGKVERDVRDIWKETVRVTLSGMWDMAPLTCLMNTTSVDRVMYGLDYPFEQAVDGKTFMEEARQSGIVSSEEYDKIAFGNAEVLLKIQRPSID